MHGQAAYFSQQRQKLLLGPGTNYLIHHLAVLQNHQRGDAHDPELSSQLHFLVHVDLAYKNVLALLSNFIHNGADHPAGAAPGRPEVQQDPFSAFRTSS